MRYRQMKAVRAALERTGGRFIVYRALAEQLDGLGTSHHNSSVLLVVQYD